MVPDTKYSSKLMVLIVADAQVDRKVSTATEGTVVGAARMPLPGLLGPVLLLNLEN